MSGIVIPTAEVGDDGNGTIRHGLDASPGFVTARSQARHESSILDACNGSQSKPDNARQNGSVHALIVRETGQSQGAVAPGGDNNRAASLVTKSNSGSVPALPANDAIPPVPSTICGACGGSGTNAHGFARCCSKCSGTGWELLVCEACGGDGDTHDGQDEDGSGCCDHCAGYGVRHCDEPRCRDVATHVFTERGQQYPLCRAHWLQWCADAEIEPATESGR